MQWTAQHPEMLRLFQLAASEAGFAAQLHRGEQVAVDEAAAQIAEAMDAGLIAESDAVLIAQAMIGVMHRLVARRLLDDAGIDAAVAVLPPRRPRRHRRLGATPPRLRRRLTSSPRPSRPAIERPTWAVRRCDPDAVGSVAAAARGRPLT